MTLQKAHIETTIVGIHDFFTDWVNGKCAGDDDTFQRNALDYISDDVVVIMPGGMRLGKRDFSGYMKSIHASNPKFRIQIRNIQICHQSGDIAVVNYQEWQRDAKDSEQANNGRVTTMVIRDRGPGQNPEFLQVHETWLPADEVAADAFSF